MSRLPLLLLLVLLGWPAACRAQQVYLDVNRDGRCDADDVLGPEVGSVDVWFVTDRDADGTPDSCEAEGEYPYTLSIFSYMVLLHAWGDGTLQYGPWIPGPSVAGFQIDAGCKTKGADCIIAYAGVNPLEPGRYKVGTLQVSVTGHPRLSFLAATPLDPELATSFGSECPGVDLDSTIKLGQDFLDACGTAAPMPSADAGTAWAAIQKLYR
jgi:hypothetical protein